LKFFADPIAWFWFALLAAALILLLGHRRKLGWLLLGIVLLASLSEALRFSDWLIVDLERPYLRKEVSPPVPADAVIVLGGYAHPSTNNYCGIQFNEAADRLITGIALVRDRKGRVLVLSGGGRGDPPMPVEAQAAAHWIRSWNLVAVPVEFLGPCGDTHDEALHASMLVRTNGWKNIILVTSAWHMRRALATFQKVGLDAIPVAADFRGLPADATKSRFSWIPRTSSLGQFNLWLEETLGYFYYWLRHWV
jgi:uncharacterized SAM-binding protein YcdF (DUF218 family)